MHKKPKSKITSIKIITQLFIFVKKFFLLLSILSTLLFMYLFLYQNNISVTFGSIINFGGTFFLLYNKKNDFKKNVFKAIKYYINKYFLLIPNCIFILIWILYKKELLEIIKVFETPKMLGVIKILEISLNPQLGQKEYIIITGIILLIIILTLLLFFKLLNKKTKK